MQSLQRKENPVFMWKMSKCSFNACRRAYFWLKQCLLSPKFIAKLTQGFKMFSSHQTAENFTPRMSFPCIPVAVEVSCRGLWCSHKNGGRSTESCELQCFGDCLNKITIFWEWKSSPGRTDVVTYHIYSGNLRAKREFKEQIVNSINPNNKKYIKWIRRLKGVDWSEGAAGGRKEQLKSWRRKRRRKRALWRNQVIPSNLQG